MSSGRGRCGKIISSQFARVDRLINALQADLVGVTCSRCQRSFVTLACMVGRSSARLQDKRALRVCFGLWARARHAVVESELRASDFLRRCLCAWSAVSSPERASLSAVHALRVEMHEKLAATDGGIGYINNRINQFPSPVDSDTEYHRRCIALADAADEEVATIESMWCGGCRSLCNQLEPLAAALKRFVVSGSLLRAQRDRGELL